MSAASRIAWTDATWNPTVGCSRVHEGCDFCYAVPASDRLARMGQSKYAGLTIEQKPVVVARGGMKRHFNGVVGLDEPSLQIPLRWRRPLKVFVNSMSDLFHETLTDEDRDRAFAVIALCPHHTFQVLTKRPGVAERYLRGGRARRGAIAYALGKLALDLRSGRFDRDIHARSAPLLNAWEANEHWPLPNLHLYASVSKQKHVDEFVPHLLRCPAAVRGLSIEPLLGPIDLSPPSMPGSLNLLGPATQSRGMHDGVNHVLLGCESRGAWAGRFGAPDEYERAAASILEQCAAAGVPAFHKQMPVGLRVSHDPADWPEWARVQRPAAPFPLTEAAA